MGSANAGVLPEPVAARPIMSLPASASGIALACIGVGCLQVRVAHAMQSSGIIPRDSNETGSSVVEVDGRQPWLFMSPLHLYLKTLEIHHPNHRAVTSTVSSTQPESAMVQRLTYRRRLPCNTLSGVPY
jgi:hypothetical protein